MENVANNASYSQHKAGPKTQKPETPKENPQALQSLNPKDAWHVRKVAGVVPKSCSLLLIFF